MRLTGDRGADTPAISHATAELGLALNEIGMAAGLTHIVTVYDHAMHRMLQRCGCAGEPLGPPQRIGGVTTYAVFYEVGPKWSVDVRKIAGDAGIQLEPIVIEVHPRARRLTNLSCSLPNERRSYAGGACTYALR